MPRLSPRQRPDRSRPKHGHRVRLLASRFRYARRHHLFGVARLYGDRIELRSWDLHGPRRQVVWLENVAQMDYHPLDDTGNVAIVLTSGEAVNLRLEKAHLWREYFENWLRYAVLPSAKLVDEADEALAISG